MMRGAGFVDFSNSVDLMTYGITEIRASKGEIQGSSFILPDNSACVLVFTSGAKSQAVEGNYDAYTNSVKIFGEGVTYNIPAEILDSVVFNNLESPGLILTRKILDSESVLMEQVVYGDFSLFKSLDVKVRRPTYNRALDIGSKKTKIVTKDIYFSESDGKMVRMPGKISKLKKHKPLGRALWKQRPQCHQEMDIVSFFECLNRN